jgi:hypothetical protein
MYKNAMRTSQFFANIPQLQSAVENPDTGVEQVDEPLGEGWALKSVTRAAKRFNENQLSFLKEKFRQGVEGRKADPRQVAEEMMHLKTELGHKRFMTQEYLSWVQISSFFSRMAAEATQGGRRGEGTPSNIDVSIDEVIRRVLGNLNEKADAVAGSVAHDVGDIEDEDIQLLPPPEDAIDQGLEETECYSPRNNKR